MSKKISKLSCILVLLIIFMISSFSVSFATDVDTTNTTNTTTSDSEQATQEDTTSEGEIYSGDLYLFDNNIVMDKLVDGNAFIFGRDVKITGQVNGNLFVFANTLSFDQCYVKNSIFACANSIYYNGACNDLYVSSNHLEMTYDSYVVRDVKSLSSDVILRAAIGRDVDLICNKVNFGEADNAPVVYGNLRYSANAEATIPEGVIGGEGSITYNPSATIPHTTTSVASIIVGFLTCIATVLVVYTLGKVLTPKFVEKLSLEKLSALRILKAFGIGLLSFVIVVIAMMILFTIMIGSNLALILLLSFMLLCLVAVPMLTIVITNALKPVLKIEKVSMFYLVLVLVNIILHGITLIPFVGGTLGVIIKLVGIGLFIEMVLPKKELTPEEKATIEEKKKQAKEQKEKRKQEKLAAKETKKKEKEN